MQFLLSFFWLYRSKVPLQEVLEISIKALHNAYLKHKASGIFSKVSQGVEIKDALGVMFDGFGVQLLSATHNEAGFLESLEVLLELYQEELQTHSEALLGAIEPVMILVLGVLVLWLALGIFCHFGSFLCKCKAYKSLYSLALTCSFGKIPFRSYTTTFPRLLKSSALNLSWATAKITA